MTRRTVRGGLAFALCAFAFATVSAALPTAAPGAAPRQQKATGPAALWHAYPLNPPPSRTFLGSYRPGVLPMSNADVKSPLIVTLLLMAIAASSAVLLRPALARVPIRRSTGRVRATPTRIDVRQLVRSGNGAQAADSAPSPWEQRLGTCEIRLWRGHGTCQLYATTGREDEAIAMSRSFRLQDPDTPNANALQALADLRRRLEASGWTIASGRDWYEAGPSGRVSESARKGGGGGI
jgi:hypothetical protein